MSANLKAHRIVFNEEDKLRPRGSFTREQWAPIVELALRYQARIHVGRDARITTGGGMAQTFHDVQPLYDWPEGMTAPPPVYHDEPRMRFYRWLVKHRVNEFYDREDSHESHY